MPTLTPEAERLNIIARALDNLPRTIPAQHRADIFALVDNPTRDNWRAARLHRVTDPNPAHPHGLTLWALLILALKPAPEQSAATPTDVQIIDALNRARICGRHQIVSKIQKKETP